MRASEAKEMRMENGERPWWCGTDRVEGRRLTYLPVVGSVGVRQVENPSLLFALLTPRNCNCTPAGYAPPRTILFFPLSPFFLVSETNAPSDT